MDEISFDELVERIADACQKMSGEDLADLYNREFGDGMVYIGDDMFEQASDDLDDEEE